MSDGIIRIADYIKETISMAESTMSTTAGDTATGELEKGLHVFHITWVSHHELSAEWCAAQAREQGDEQTGRREGKREGRRLDEREG